MESTFIRSPIFGLERRLLNCQWNLHFKVRIRNAWNPLNLLTFKALKLRTILRHVRFWLEPQFLGRIQIVLETFKSNTPETSLSLLLWRKWLRFPYLCSWIDTGRTGTDRIDPDRTAHAAPWPDRTGPGKPCWYGNYPVIFSFIHLRWCTISSINCMLVFEPSIVNLAPHKEVQQGIVQVLKDSPVSSVALKHKEGKWATQNKKHQGKIYEPSLVLSQIGDGKMPVSPVFKTWVKANRSHHMVNAM